MRATSSDTRFGGRLGEGWQETFRSESIDKGSRVKVSAGRDICKRCVCLLGGGYDGLAPVEVRSVSWGKQTLGNSKR